MTMHASLAASGTVQAIYCATDDASGRTYAHVVLEGCSFKCAECPTREIGKAVATPIRNRCVACGKCVLACPVGRHVLLPQPSGGELHDVHPKVECIGCGRCSAICRDKALCMQQPMMQVWQVMDRIAGCGLIDGVILCGGEAALQHDFAIALLDECRAKGFATAVQTGGHVRWSILADLSTRTDEVLFELKHISSIEHRRMTGISNEVILHNLSLLLAGTTPVVVRVPLAETQDTMVSSVLNYLERIMGQTSALKSVELLPKRKCGFASSTEKTSDVPEYPKLSGITGTTNLPVRIVQ